MHGIIETSAFRRAAEEAGLAEEEVVAIITAIAANPLAGDLIPGTGGARKVRFGGRGKGKSGGYRVITYYAAEDVPVFLLDVYGKGDRIDLSQAERNALRSILGRLADAWREGAKAAARGPRR